MGITKKEPKFRERIIIPQKRVVYIGLVLWVDMGIANIIYYNSKNSEPYKGTCDVKELLIEDEWIDLISIEEFDKIHALITSGQRFNADLAQTLLKAYHKEFLKRLNQEP